MFAILFVSAIGCGQSSAPTPSGAAAKPATPAGGGHEASGEAGATSKHSGWWCDEHGVPEEVCSMCSPKVAADFQKEGDWCADHDRAKSQCFKCNPALKETFADQYRAKYGKEPPAMEEEDSSKT
jgi:hypothetical protein